MTVSKHIAIFKKKFYTYVCVCGGGAFKFLISISFSEFEDITAKDKEQWIYLNEFSILYLHLVKSDTLSFSHGID